MSNRSDDKDKEEDSESEDYNSADEDDTNVKNEIDSDDDYEKPLGNFSDSEDENKVKQPPKTKASQPSKPNTTYSKGTPVNDKKETDGTQSSSGTESYEIDIDEGKDLIKPQPNSQMANQNMQNKNMVKGHLPNQKDMQPPIAKAPKQTTDQVQSQSKSGQKSVAKPNIPNEEEKNDQIPRMDKMPNVNPNSSPKVPVNNTKSSQPKVVNQNPSVQYDNSPHQEDSSQGFSQKPGLNQSYPFNQNDGSSQGPSSSHFDPNANYSQPNMNQNNTGGWSQNSSNGFQNFGGGFQQPNYFPGANQNAGDGGQGTNSTSGFNGQSANQYPGFGGQGANQFSGFGGQGSNMPFGQQMGPSMDSNGNFGYWVPNPMTGQMFFVPIQMNSMFQSTTTPPPKQNSSSAEEPKVAEEQKQEEKEKMDPKNPSKKSEENEKPQSKERSEEKQDKKGKNKGKKNQKKQDEEEKKQDNNHGEGDDEDEEVDNQQEKIQKDEAKNKQEEKEEVKKNELVIETKLKTEDKSVLEKYIRLHLNEVVDDQSQIDELFTIKNPCKFLTVTILLNLEDEESVIDEEDLADKNSWVNQIKNKKLLTKSSIKIKTNQQAINYMIENYTFKDGNAPYVDKLLKELPIDLKINDEDSVSLKTFGVDDSGWKDQIKTLLTEASSITDCFPIELDDSVASNIDFLKKTAKKEIPGFGNFVEEIKEAFPDLVVSQHVIFDCKNKTISVSCPVYAKETINIIVQKIFTNFLIIKMKVKEIINSK